MKAVVLHEYGPAKNLVLEEVKAPQPGPGEVLVHIHAAGVNPIDWKIRSGAMAKMFSIDFPAILGYDMAGTVQEVGEGVIGFAPGDRVFARTQRTYAEFTVAKADELAKVPQDLELTTAAAIPVVATTGDQLIREQGRVQAGQSILLTGALGSVGRFALFTAIELGAKVIAGVRRSTSTKHSLLGQRPPSTSATRTRSRGSAPSTRSATPLEDRWLRSCSGTSNPAAPMSPSWVHRRTLRCTQPSR